MVKALVNSLKERDLDVNSEEGMEKMFLGTMFLAKDMIEAVSDSKFAEEYKKSLLGILELTEVSNA